MQLIRRKLPLHSTHLTFPLPAPPIALGVELQPRKGVSSVRVLIINLNHCPITLRCPSLTRSPCATCSVPQDSLSLSASTSFAHALAEEEDKERKSRLYFRSLASPWKWIKRRIAFFRPLLLELESDEGSTSEEPLVPLPKLNSSSIIFLSIFECPLPSPSSSLLLS